MQEAIDQLVNEEEGLEGSLEELAAEQREAAEKLRRKRAECDRVSQRLLQLKAVKAPYQDELDALEEELAGLYGAYLSKFRSLEYLEAEVSKIRRCDSPAAMRCLNPHGHALSVNPAWQLGALSCP